MYAFEFVKAKTLAEAVKALGREEAQALGGGQTLIPTLKSRLAQPAVLVSLNGIAELKGVKREGDVLVVHFTVAGVACIGLNGGPVFKHSEAFSFQVHTYTQEETDRLWNAIVGNGGQESMCGWCKDKWGISWQITPRALTDVMTSGDQAAAKRAFEAMMTMKKIDVATIEAAIRGEEVGAA